MPPDKKRSIVVVDYDPAWPARFSETKARIERLLAGLIVDIEHVGSTAVPRLCAKPKIDIDVVLLSEDEVPHATNRLVQAGYTSHGNKYNDGMWAFTTGKGSYGERIYLCAPGNETHHKRLLFRNYLRAHGDVAEAYGSLKKRLADEAIDDWDHYTGGKGPFVAEIVQRARNNQ